MRRLLALGCVVLFLLGAGSLALTGWLWFGDWPREARELVEHLKSAERNRGRPPEPLLMRVEARSPLLLDGRWQAVIDPYDRGALLGLAPRAVEPSSPSDLAEFSFENGLELDVPGDWNSQDPRLFFYQGVVWYKRRFESPAGDGARRFLHFGAANYRASVYLNGRLLGEHEGGFTPFNFEVTDGLREGDNLLVVKVDNRLAPDDVPTPTTDWLNHGGLTRDVSLVTVPAAFVRSWELRLADGDGHRLVGWAQLDGASPGTRVSLRVPGLGVDGEARTDAEGRARFELDATPARWSPESPRRYRVEWRSGEDRVDDEIGFRQVEAVGRQIHLNGRPIFLRGISLHEEALGPHGRIRGREDAEALLAVARELGCNFVRLAHYTHHPAMVETAERLGLLVWAEIPVYWNIDFGNPATLARAKQQLGEMIERDRNRAAVVLWSIGNETPHSDARLAFLRALADHVRALDPSRLVTAALLPDSLGRFLAANLVPALLGFPPRTWRFTVADPLGEVVDVPALNQYFGWYYSGGIAALTPLSSHRARRVVLDHMDRIRFELPVDKPLVMSEFGAGALAGWHAPEDELVAYSEEYQALVYRRQIAMLAGQEGVAGWSPWLLKDFASPLRLYQGVQDHWNRKGLVDDDGRRKLAFAVLRDHYRSLR